MGNYEYSKYFVFAVINRCISALTKLDNVHVPNRLFMNSSTIESEIKAIFPKFSSPLKRTLPMEFFYTDPCSAATSQQNKLLVDSLISTMDLNDVVTRPKTKNMKDAACQTTKSYCDVCEIRDATRLHEACTSTEPEYFSSTVHTQVVEHDLVNSKAVFNPSGSISDGAPISIAHLTPAQLVSQLAARAKTLKQSDPPSSSNDYMRRPNNYNYDGRSGGSQQYQNYNYRY